MVYGRVRVREEDIKRLAPPEICRMLSGLRVYCYGVSHGNQPSEKNGDDENRLLGVALFTIPDSVPGMAQLHYINIAKELRGSDVADKLLKTAFKSLKNAGVDACLYRSSSLFTGRLMDEYALSLKYGFTPLSSDVKIFIYTAESIKNSKFVKDVLKAGSKLPRAVKAEGNEDIIARFNRKKDHGLLFLNEESFDPEYSYFYIKNEDIHVAACAFRKKDAVAITNVYVSPECKEDLAMPVILTNCMHSAVKDDEVRYVKIQLAGKVKSQALSKAVGSPDAAFDAIEMIRYL